MNAAAYPYPPRTAVEKSLTVGERLTLIAKIKSYSLPYQLEVKAFYRRRSIQILVALIIFWNFVTSAVRAQILPEKNTTADSVFRVFEAFFVYAFLMELMLNMYGHYC